MDDSFLEPVVEVETVVGSLLLQQADELITPALQRWKTWEPGPTRYLERTLQPGDTFVDVGAHVGYFSVLASRMVGPTGSVIAVEPEERNRDLLYRNLTRNGCERTRVIAAAAGAQSRLVGLALDEINRGAHRVVDPNDPDADVDTPCVRLDEVLPTRVDFIKVDAQGYDHEIVEGLAETIAGNPQLRLLVELSKREMARRGVDPAEVLDGYRAQDFVFRALDGNGHATEALAADFLALLSVPNQEAELNLVLERPSTPPFTGDSRPALAGDLDVRRNEGGIVVFQHDPTRMHKLNGSAAVTFELCTGKHSVAAIVALVQSLYELDEPPTADIEACLDQLRRKELLTDCAS